MRRHIANIITSFRILGSVLLFFFPVFSSAFYITYLLCGFSDMIDGTIAKRTNSVSDIGAKIDSIADIVFVAAAFIKLLPIIHIPWLLWMWIGIIATIKICNIIFGFIFKKQFISLHTIMNKITGLLLFLLPLIIYFVDLKYIAIVVCSCATFSAIQECFYIVRDIKTNNLIRRSV